ncbi:MAG: hypothetical protein ABUL45_05325, partial [Rhodanobacter sp.]
MAGHPHVRLSGATSPAVRGQPIRPGNISPATAKTTVCACRTGWHGDCSPCTTGNITHHWRHVMKFESLILASLFAVCFAVCALVMG